MPLRKHVIEAAKVTAKVVNGQFPPLWVGGLSATEVTFPQFAAAPATLGTAGTYFHLIRVGSAGVYRGAACLYGRGATGSSLTLSLYTEAELGRFALRATTGNLVSASASAMEEVGGDFGGPVNIAIGDLCVLGLTWGTSGSGDAPTIGQRSGVLPVQAPYGHQVKLSTATALPSSLTFQALTVGDRAPWIGLYK
ncbi:hypothetical protein 7S3_22 [uncultured Caudovirales phage]|uniref:Uncharacterized protein n=1 Tax=uncultured Caudovirales phage TaxID=2100421 RepID=A0A2H4J288_9CAUD|nr:hypothetical protein 7S3_22 [uncultured Caudovirales phage]